MESELKKLKDFSSHARRNDRRTPPVIPNHIRGAPGMSGEESHARKVPDNDLSLAGKLDC